MIRLIYNLLFPLALFFFLPGYLIKMFRRGNYRNKFGQRLGFYDRETQARLSEHRQSWLHAVSVGEVMIALKLASSLKEREPALRVALTTTTSTGFALATRQAPVWIHVLYAPLDFWPIMRRAFAVIRPTRIILIEAEVWPNLTAIAHRQKIPLALVNARLSPRSETRFRRFNYFVRPYFQKLDLVAVQEQEDIARWESLGVTRSCLELVGSIKFDPTDIVLRSDIPRDVLRTFGISPDDPIMVAGSTHPGEEKILGHIFAELRREFPNLLLVIAPRHVERASEIAGQLNAFGLTTKRRSEPPETGRLGCLLLDTTGELRDWYSIATIVFIGKSLAARGGQNPVEAIVADRPVIFGPHMENFATLARDLIAADGAVQVSDQFALTTAAAELLCDARKRQRLTRNARQVLDRHRGATNRTAALLENLTAQAQ